MRVMTVLLRGHGFAAQPSKHGLNAALDRPVRQGELGLPWRSYAMHRSQLELSRPAPIRHGVVHGSGAPGGALQLCGGRRHLRDEGGGTQHIFLS
jgi:hypothetical protein